ncbi:uncharacterized protein PV07_09128 [Cladophialophora immunda]|uniref:Alpha/beta hydrolase fold-3 domain-containing protein n=1 Tax=Cladophialophora immunda TaxID=569365 RepID=A0A0D1ZE77_9EURO|nr:uncharacterized protein PV07_09128 [Cladophialophora immunda]KIW25996.1 hypothetical protein PV07_09128 [Cladophialophora immunda]
MANFWVMIFSHPFQFLTFLYSFTVQCTLVSLRRLLLPQIPTYQTFRQQIQRAYLSSTSVHFPELPHRLPVTGCSEAEARRIGKDWIGYVIPGTSNLDDAASSSRHAARVVLYAHGGGYLAGEARMYRNYMTRWVQAASLQDIKLTFVSVEYPLTSEAPHPAQREAFVRAYRSLLNQGIPSSRILFMGDSAGGGLCLLGATEIFQSGLPQPAGIILLSPWMDLSLSSFEGGNALVETDFVVHLNSTVPRLVKLFLDTAAPTSPEVNPLCRQPEELEFLPPTLTFVGGAEFALQEAKDLDALLNRTKVQHELVIDWGEMHIYALGSAFIDPMVRARTDDKIVKWIQSCTAKDHPPG